MMNILSSNMRHRLLPLILIVSVVLAGFSLILVQRHTFQLFEKDIEKRMRNATARMALGELIVSDLRKVQADFYAAIIIKDSRAQQLKIDAGLVTIAETHRLLNVLENGGMFSRTLPLNLAEKDKADLSMGYIPEHKLEFIVEVLALRPQLMELKEKFKELPVVTASRNRMLAKSPENFSVEEEQPIRSFVKKSHPLFVRMTENANKLAFDGKTNLQIFQNKIQVARKKNRQTELLWAFSAVIAVLTLISLIFRQTLLTQHAQQKTLLELQQTREDLQESNKAILSLNETLEEQVAARTMELTATNSTLTEEIAVRRKTEEELQKSKAIWERTFDSITDVVTIFDPSLVIVRANSIANQLYSFEDGVEGHHCYELFHGSEQPCSDCPILETKETFSPYIKEMYNEKLQKTFLVSAAPVLDEKGNLDYITHFAKDISDIKETMDKVRRQKEYIEDIFNLVPQGLITVDEEKNPVEWNLSFDTIVTHWAERVKMQEIEVREQLLMQLRQELTVNDNGMFFLSLNEQPLCFEFLSSLVPSFDQIDRVVSLRDVTVLTAMERQLAQAQKLEAVGQLAAGIAHEINTPMQYVQNNVTFFERAFKDLKVLLVDYQQLQDKSETPLTDEAREHLENISLDFLMEEIPESIADAQDGINRVVTIVSAMKEFSHPGSNEKTAIDLNRALESTITVSRNEWKYVAEMVTDFDPDLPMVPCLPDQLNQVVLNLIINGAHAIGESRTEDSGDLGTITISTEQDQGEVVIRVRDTGCGMAKEVQDRIFEPFFTTKEVGKGTGQGLSLVYTTIVDRHGGTISVDSDPGQGSEFIIKLPITSENNGGTA